MSSIQKYSSGYFTSAILQNKGIHQFFCPGSLGLFQQFFTLLAKNTHYKEYASAALNKTPKYQSFWPSLSNLTLS